MLLDTEQLGVEVKHYTYFTFCISLYLYLFLNYIVIAYQTHKF
jgi:hypothetical protein